MDNARLGSEVERLRRAVGPELCAERPCRRVSTVEVVRHPDGTEERLGEPPPALCASCPERSNPKPRIRHIKVVRAYPRPDEAAAEPAYELPEPEPQAEPAKLGLHAEDLKGTEDPDEHAEDEALAYMRRRQQREDEAFAKARARRRNRGGPTFDPEDFGVS